MSHSGFWVQSLLGFGKQFRNFAFVLIYMLIKQPSFYLSWKFWIGVGAVIILYVLFSYIRHLNFYFWVDDERKEFILKKGIFNKTQVVLKFDNIQQVNIKQNMIQQALDLYAIEIESAGSSEKEVNLYALEETQALALKEYLTRKRLGDLDMAISENVQPEDASHTHQDTAQPVFKIKNRRIFLVSLFTNYEQAFGIFLAFLIGLIDTIRELTPWTRQIFDWESGFESILQFSALIVGWLILFFLLIPLFINIFKYVLRYYGFTLYKQNNGNMTMRFGLFEIQNILLNREKIQMVSYIDNWMLRRWNLVIMALHQIHTQPSQSNRAEKSLIHIPGIRQVESQLLLEIIFDKQFSGIHNTASYEVIRPKIGLLILRFTWVTLLVAALLLMAFINQVTLPFWLGIGALGILMYGLNYQYYRNYRLLHAPGYLVKISGIWDITRIVLPVQKVRSVRVDQNFIQKRTGTAHLSFSTASGDVRIAFIPYSLAVEISNQILFEIEK